MEAGTQARRLTSAISALERLFELPADRWIAMTRLGLACVLFVAGLFFAGPEPSSQGARFTLAVYLCLAAGLWAAERRGRVTVRLSHAAHALDVAVSSALLYLTDPTTSPFFVLFIFIVITGALRWDWRGAVATAGLATVILIVLYLIDSASQPTGAAGNTTDVSRAIIRGGFLIIAGVLLAYVGAFHQRGRDRFAKLAAWPAPKSLRASEAPFVATLAHVAAVACARRVLVVWDQKEEPYRHLGLWSEEKFLHSREKAQTFGGLVAPKRRRDAFVARVEAREGGGRGPSAIDPELSRLFNIGPTITAPFVRPLCWGRVFIFEGTREWTEDDIALAEVIASRIGIELEDHLLRLSLEQSGAERERAALARDLHDGILQSLAAANIQLKIASGAVPPASQDELARIRSILMGEAQRIRSFVEGARSTSNPTSGVVDIAPDIKKRIANLREQWPCAIDLVMPAPVLASISTARHLPHMLSEAVANAVRHGRARRVEIRVDRLSDRLLMQISDDGHGFDNLSGSYAQDELNAKNLGPLSLRSRVSELSGELFLSSSPSGTEIRIEIPA